MFLVNHAPIALTVFNPKPSTDLVWMNEGIDAIRDRVVHHGGLLVYCSQLRT